MFVKYVALSMALATFALGQDDTTSSNPRIIVDSSTVTGVYTPVETTTNVEFSTTSLPHSLDTVTSVSSNLITSTSLSTNVYTTNTLSDTMSAAAATATASGGAGSMLKAGSGVVGAALLGAAALL